MTTFCSFCLRTLPARPMSRALAVSHVCRSRRSYLAPGEVPNPVPALDPSGGGYYGCTVPVTDSDREAMLEELLSGPELGPDDPVARTWQVERLPGGELYVWPGTAVLDSVDSPI